MAKVVFQVDGMTCGGCAKSVEKIILKQAPDGKVSVDLAAKRVEAQTSCDAKVLADALAAGGFPAKITG